MLESDLDELKMTYTVYTRTYMFIHIERCIFSAITDINLLPSAVNIYILIRHRSLSTELLLNTTAMKYFVEMHFVVL